MSKQGALVQVSGRVVQDHGESLGVQLSDGQHIFTNVGNVSIVEEIAGQEEQFSNGAVAELSEKVQAAEAKASEAEAKAAEAEAKVVALETELASANERIAALTNDLETHAQAGADATTAGAGSENKANSGPDATTAQAGADATTAGKTARNRNRS